MWSRAGACVPAFGGRTRRNVCLVCVALIVPLVEQTLTTLVQSSSSPVPPAKTE